MDSLEKVFAKSNLISDVQGIPTEIITYIEQIGNVCEEKKGLYTVLTTLLYYKYLHPKQDIRYHQAQLPNGFSGRSFDTKNVTPVLRKLNLPAMSESGWLTRSLEQPYPYNLNYNGKIGALKQPFLLILEYVEKNPNRAYDLLRILLHTVDKVSKRSKIKIVPLDNPENIVKIFSFSIAKHWLYNFTF